MSLHHFRWYHGQVPRGETERLLRGKQPGIYIVRDSGTMVGDFVLSVSENSKVSHYIINNKGNHYKIGDQTFADIPSIISFYKTHFLDTTTLVGAVPREIKVQALYNFEGNDPDDLPFQKGEILTVINQDEESWWTAQNSQGQRGSIPVPYIHILAENRSLPNPSPIDRRASAPISPPNGNYFDPPMSSDDRRSYPNFAATPSGSSRISDPANCRDNNRVVAPPPGPPTTTTGPMLARAIKDRVCTPYDSEQLGFKTNDLIKVLKQNDNGIWEGQLNDKVGEFPMTLVVLVDPNTLEPYSNGYQE